MSNEQTNTKQRRRFSTDVKASILKQHLADKVAISDLCDEHGIQPSVIYGWLQQVYERLPVALEATKQPTTSSKEQQLSRENEALKARLAKKDAVIAEISAEYVDLKKELGVL